MKSSLLILLGLAAAGTAPAATDVSYVTGSSQKLEQLIGDVDFQTGLPTLSLTATNYHLSNTDLGVSFRHKGMTYVLFGDSNFPGTADAIGYTTDTDPEAGLTLSFPFKYSNFLPIAIPGISHGAYDVPIYGLSSNGKMYLYYSTDSDPSVPIMGRTVLSVSTDDGASFSAPLYTLSSNLFINLSVIRVNCADWPGLPQTNGLGLLLFASGPYRQSEVYLAFQAETGIEDLTTIRFMAGLDSNKNPTWSLAESNAARLAAITYTNAGGLHGVGELSATFNVYLRKWMLFYNLSGQIQFRTADQPWGPFSAHGISFDPTTDQGFTNFIYLAGANDTNLCQPNVTGHDLSNSGGVYGPYIFNAFSAGSASETNIQTTLYHTMSTWNPYNSVLMRAIFKRRPPPTIYTGARVTNSVSTASPGGADAFVFSGTNANSNYGTNLSLLIKNNGTNVSNFSRKAYLRFPLSLSSTQRVCSGSLTLTISGSSAATVPFTYNVYGLRSSSPGQSWGETNITWNNAPANDTNDAEALDLNQTIFLGSFTTSTNRPVGAQFSFSSLLLNDFLNQTTNGPLTLIISRLTVDSATEPFGARESAFQPPTLSFVTVPRLPNLSILQNSTAGPFSFNVDSTVTNAGSLTVTGGSSNTNLVPKSNIVLGGSATNRTVTITPATNQTGTTTITLTVSDGIATTDSASFQLSVVPTNRPTLIGPQRTNGQFQFFINSATGSSYVIQSSSNLKAWVSVQTNSAPGSFTDPGPAVGSAKFFRVFYTP